MARSTYVYVLTWKDHVASAAPILTATVKREFLDGLAHAGSQIDDTDAWRMRDGELLERTHLGSGAEYLAKERPPVVVTGSDDA